jgi:hypothetical protein
LGCRGGYQQIVPLDTIPHDKLMLALQMRIRDRNVLKLIRMWLQSPIEETDEAGHKSRQCSTAGTPQGEVISPLLVNLYLHWFEVLFYRDDGPACWAKPELVRYADDFVVLARYQGERLRDWIETTLEGRMREIRKSGLTWGKGRKAFLLYTTVQNFPSMEFLQKRTEQTENGRESKCLYFSTQMRVCSIHEEKLNRRCTPLTHRFF